LAHLSARHHQQDNAMNHWNQPSVGTLICKTLPARQCYEPLEPAISWPHLSARHHQQDNANLAINNTMQIRPWEDFTCGTLKIFSICSSYTTS